VIAKPTTAENRPTKMVRPALRWIRADTEAPSIDRALPVKVVGARLATTARRGVVDATRPAQGRVRRPIALPIDPIDTSAILPSALASLIRDASPRRPAPDPASFALRNEAHRDSPLRGKGVLAA